ncbi:hypothetical protein GGS26DRAFT_591234 [Hypomontagnella submonticulosa]|nr:hypothetical protein GGS26DRAFT_591234 [Hypomontagnella submonticulosa]
MSNTATLELYVAICKEHTPGANRHWILMLVPKGPQHGTWYHVTRRPNTNGSYELEIQMKPVNSFGIESHHYICSIEQKHINKVKSSAQKIPLQRCQLWTVNVLEDLEKKSLVPQGTYNAWFEKVENNPRKNDAETSSARVSNARTTARTFTNTTKVRPDWVWDARAGLYRYWDDAARKWVWQPRR